LDTIVKKLTEIGYVKEVLAVGDKKFFGIAKVKYGRHFRRIDIMVTPKEEFPFAVMYFTGSKEFNVDLRNHCLKLGYSLNEYRLTNKKDKNPIDRKLESEEEKFDFLGFKFVPPFERKANILKFYKK
jgi:DNA polymerase/3'-5' exonuclease PolX